MVLAGLALLANLFSPLSKISLFDAHTATVLPASWRFARYYPQSLTSPHPTGSRVVAVVLRLLNLPVLLHFKVITLSSAIGSRTTVLEWDTL